MAKDPYPKSVWKSAEYARGELKDGFVPNPEDFYEEPGTWNGGQTGARRTFSGYGVHISRDRYDNSQDQEQWKVEVEMMSYPKSSPLLIADELSVDEMQNVIRAFKYRLMWFLRQGDYEPSYELKE